MRKFLSSTLLILIVLILLIPLFFSFSAKRQCQKIIEIINFTTPLSAKMINYERGWFSSEATTQISLDKLDLPNKELYQLIIKAHISHGPVFIDWTRFHFIRALVYATINLNNAQNNWLNRGVNAAPLAKVKLKFKLSGKTDLLVESPSLNYQYPDGEVNYGGLKLRAFYSKSYNDIESKLEFGGLDIKTKKWNTHLGEITSTYKANRTSNGIWLGERSLHCKAFSTTNENNHTIGLENLRLHNLLTPTEKDRVNTTTIIDLDNFNINGAIFSQNKLDLETNRIDKFGVTKLYQQLISSKIIYSPTGALFDTLISILNNESEINIKQLDTVTPWGKLMLNVKMSFANKQNNFGIFALLANSTINSNITVEPALALHLLEKFYQIMPSEPTSDPANEAKVSLEKLKNSGNVTVAPDDPYLHLTFDYKDNRPLINGKQLVLTLKQ
jgi:uncharacterized protein YdgA (DUF945 family)